MLRHHTLPPHLFLVLVLVGLVTALLMLGAASAGADVAVSHCGQLIHEGETAYLKGDLDCRGLETEGVVLSHRARLQLDGHRIIGGNETTGGSWQGVRCKGGSRCTVTGPGLIEGFSASGVAGTKVHLRELTIRGNGRAGVAAYERVRMRDVIIEENAAMGVLTSGQVRARRSRVGAHPEGEILEVPAAVPAADPADS